MDTHGRESYWKALTSAMIRRSVDRAADKSIFHNLTLTELREDLYPEEDSPVCLYCKSPMKVVYGEMTRSSPTLDRVIPELGYTKDNVVVCCNGCNTFKNDTASSEDMSLKIKISRTMLKKLKEVEGNSTIILSERRKKKA